MPVGPPPERLARDLATLYAEAELALLRATADAVHRGATVDVDDLAAQSREANRLRRQAARIADRLDARARPAGDAAVSAAAAYGDRRAAADLRRLLGGAADQYTTPLDRGPIDQIARSLNDRMTPVHRSVTRAVDDVYAQVMARSAVPTFAAPERRVDVAQRALDRFARRGITGFVDRAGRNWDLTTYAEMASRSVTARAATAAGTARMQAAGIDFVQVSAHQAACDLCGPWEGTILAASGSHPPGRVQVRSLTSDEWITIDVAGGLDDATAAGFQHPNCRHSVSAYLPGASRVATPPDPDPRRAEKYADTQHHRYLERQVRAAKRREAVAMTDAARKEARRAVRAAQGRIREHVKRTGAPRQPNREQIHRAR